MPRQSWLCSWAEPYLGQRTHPGASHWPALEQPAPALANGSRPLLRGAQSSQGHNEVNAARNRFAGQELLVRHGRWEGDVSFDAALIRDTATGTPERVRVTYEVIGWLFGDGQTAIRQALTAVAHAAALNPLLDPKLRYSI